MTIVILMGGVGMRFASMGYEKPKPLIRVDGKTMAEHVVDLYPGDHKFMFACNEQFADHVEINDLARAKNARVTAIPLHRDGPVRSLSHIWDELAADEPVLVSYCDFSARWNFADFERTVSEGRWDGAVPCYTGFHPHLVHKKLYAGVLADPSGRMTAIREKHSFTEPPEDSYHSAGMYYFARADEMREYGKKLIDSGERVNGERYVSMIFYGYVRDGKRALVYPLTHFLQWGTPEDLEEYEAWSRFLQGQKKGVTDIPYVRESHVAIPHSPGTSAYERSRAYWESYFST